MKKAAPAATEYQNNKREMTLDCCLSLQAFCAVKGHFCGFLVSNIFLDTSSFCGFSMPFLLVFCFFHYVLFFLISESSLMFRLNRISVRSSFLGASGQCVFRFRSASKFFFCFAIYVDLLPESYRGIFFDRRPFIQSFV